MSWRRDEIGWKECPATSQQRIPGLDVDLDIVPVTWRSPRDLWSSRSRRRRRLRITEAQRVGFFGHGRGVRQKPLSNTGHRDNRNDEERREQCRRVERIEETRPVRGSGI